MVCGRSSAITKLPTYFAFALANSSALTGSELILSISFNNSTTELSVTILRTLAVALKVVGPYLLSPIPE